jgi:lysophospholipase L1-like esterase
VRPLARISAAALLVVCAATGPTAAQTGAVPAPPDPRLLIIGDSVILGAQPWIVAALAARGWRVNQTSQESLHTWEAGRIVDANRGAFGLGDVVILQLGTNDGGNPAELSAYIDELMGHLATVDRVYWVNMRQFRPWVPAANAVIADAATRYPNLRVIDWDSHATPNPTFVAGDGYHLNAGGAAFMAQLLAYTLDAYLLEVTAGATTLPPTTVAPSTVAPTTPVSTSSTSASRPEKSEGIALPTVLVALAGVLVFSGVLAVVSTRRGATRRGARLR